MLEGFLLPIPSVFRDNMVVKYGKGYAMTETTLLVCDFSEAADTAEKLAKKRKKESVHSANISNARRFRLVPANLTGLSINDSNSMGCVHKFLLLYGCVHK